MSAEDPTEELAELEQLMQVGSLHDTTAEWVVLAMDKVTRILATIDSMQSHGVDAPTPRQRLALHSYYAGACKRLSRPYSEFTLADGSHEEADLADDDDLPF